MYPGVNAPMNSAVLMFGGRVPSLYRGVNVSHIQILSKLIED